MGPTYTASFLRGGTAYQVLVVDDDASVRDLVRDTLESQEDRYAVFSAADGVEAWALMENQRFDLVLSDWEMPRMGGVELVRRIRTRFAHLPVLLMTGSYTRADKDLAEKAGATSFLRKPFDVLTFLTVVQNLLDRYEQELIQGRAEKPARILVVEDTVAIRRIVVHMLRDCGYFVDEAADGRQAMSLLRSQPPDLVILDLMIPEIDGFTICRQMRKSAELADIPIIVCSSRDSKSDVVRAVSEGANDYIVKPFKRDDVLNRVARALKRGAARTPAP